LYSIIEEIGEKHLRIISGGIPFCLKYAEYQGAEKQPISLDVKTILCSGNA
jgi:hypothetical protein